MNASLWIEILQAAVLGVKAGVDVFGRKTDSIAERLKEKPREAGKDIKDALRQLANPEPDDQ